MNDPRRNQDGFLLLPFLGLIVAILLVTGIGQKMWRGALNMGSSCRELADATGVYAINEVCDEIGTYMAGLRLQLEYMVSSSQWGDSMDLEGFAGMMAREFASSTMGGFNSPQLSGLLNMGGGSSSSLSQALSLGSLGNSALMKGNVSEGLPYLKSSASMGDVGVLSQLSLGSAYANGTGGLVKNTQLSQYYNGMALNSIQSLQSSGSPQADQLLSALPASPDAMIRSLSSALK